MTNISYTIKHYTLIRVDEELGLTKKYDTLALADFVEKHFYTELTQEVLHRDGSYSTNTFTGEDHIDFLVDEKNYDSLDEITYLFEQSGQYYEVEVHEE